MQKITPMLWYNTEAEEAAKLYTSIFRNSSIGNVSRYGDHGPGPKGQAMTVSFTIDGQNFTALNGGPHFTFNEAISLVVNCDSQAEIDEYWAKLIADGGKESQCGWLKDKYGLSWQIIPSVLPKLAMGPNGGKVMRALMKMVKLDIATLEKAAAC
jgi:predicted 3-demethylubiquinone-9 3-methyltransferase (glyoxalase superfamily)